MSEKRKPKGKPGPKPGSKRSRPAKDRVLQARIPQQLDHQLRSRADSLGLSVSTVVRNVLLNTFDLVEDIVADSAQITRAIQGHRAAPEEPGAGAVEDVIGWQEAVLNLNGVCDHCNAILTRGSRAALGIPTGSRPALLCLDCLGELANPAELPNQEGAI